MRKFQWLVVGMMLLLATTPTTASAQEKKEGDDFIHDVLWTLFGPNWQVFGMAGVSTNGRYLLQEPTGSTGRRALRNNSGVNLGIGAGVDFLLRSGLQFTYTYSHNSLTFRTDNGDGSDTFDSDPDAELRTNVLGAEYVRYLLPSRVFINPYATAGILGAWWGLDRDGGEIIPAGGSSQFRMGANGAIGLQAQVDDHWGARVEANFATIRNPFTGKRSFVAIGGATLDEPTRVNRNDFRLVGVYYFKKPNVVKQ